MSEGLLSIVIPVYNEGKNIEVTLPLLTDRVKAPFEVLIVHDQASDNTLPVVARLKASDPHRYHTVRTVQNHVARGPSGALRQGFLATAGDQVLVLMADLCDDIDQIEMMREMMRTEGYGLVCPSRYCAGGRQELDQPIKIFLPRAAGFLLKHLFRFPLVDATNSYRLYSRRVLQAFPLTSTHSFSVTLEIAAKAYHHGFTFKEIPTVWKMRMEGKSRFPLFRSIFTYLPWFWLVVKTTYLPSWVSGHKRLAWQHT